MKDDRDVLAMGGTAAAPAGVRLPTVAVAAPDLGGVFGAANLGRHKGVVAARSAARLWCASLVVPGHPPPSAPVVWTRRISHREIRGPPERKGADDLATGMIDAPPRAELTPNAPPVSSGTEEARQTLTLGDSRVDPDDIAYATRRCLRLRWKCAASATGFGSTKTATDRVTPFCSVIDGDSPPEFMFLRLGGSCIRCWTGRSHRRDDWWSPISRLLPAR
jgi:hypothetical protein